MDSINKNRPEDNHQDLAGGPAIQKIQELVKQAPTCFLCTSLTPKSTTNKRFETRPMAVQQVDDAGCVWFLSSSDSAHNAEITKDAAVQLLFQGSPHSEFLTLYGSATIGRDKAKIKELYEPIMRTWFTGGVDDPRITTICVQPTQGYYWDTKHNRAIAFAKMVVGAITGKTLDDSIEGVLRV
jgi:general stress protein 26